MPARLLGTLLKGLAAIATLAMMPPAFATELRIGGTGAALGGMKIIGAEFEKRNPDVEVTVFPSLGSSGGIKALVAGAVDIAVSARQLKPKEAEKGLRAKLYATTPLALVTSSSTQSHGLSMGELAAIFAGDMTEWEDGTQIRLVLRPKSETTTKALQSLSDEMGDSVELAHARQGMLVASNDQDNADALEKITGSLGVITLGQIATEERNIKVLLLDGVLPEAGAAPSRNILSTTSLFVVSTQDKPQVVEEFISFLFSPKGQEILDVRNHASAK